jgi:hypothetical protein
MNHEEFDKVFEETVAFCREVLLVKGREYTPEHDRFHNFTVAASLMGCSPEQALGGFLAKHLVSIYDLLQKPSGEVPMAVWDEKIGDALNYLFLLRGIVREYDMIQEKHRQKEGAFIDDLYYATKNQMGEEVGLNLNPNQEQQTPNEKLYDTAAKTLDEFRSSVKPKEDNRGKIRDKYRNHSD